LDSKVSDIIDARCSREVHLTRSHRRSSVKLQG